MKFALIGLLLMSMPVSFGQEIIVYKKAKTATLKDKVKRVATKVGICPKLIHGIIFTESTLRAHVVNWNDGGSASFGLGQIKLKTAKWLGFKGTWKDLLKPEVNLFWTATYLDYQLKRYNGNVKRAISAYNLGHSNVNKNSKYVNKVLLASQGF